MVSKSKPARVFLVGGGSGGHVTPLLALAKMIKRRRLNWQLTYIGSRDDRIAQKLVRGQAQLFFDIRFIAAGKFRRFSGYRGLERWRQVLDIFKNLVDLVLVIFGFFESLYVLIRRRPDIIFSKGGYPGLGPCLAAVVLRIPLVVHDSDAVAGLTHRLVGRWARLRLTGLPAKPVSGRTRYVGVPIGPIPTLTPKTKAAILAEFGLESDTELILIFGGGLGAVNLNRAIVDVLDDLELRPQSHLILITGNANLDQTQTWLAGADRRDRLTLLPFSQRLLELIAVSEIVVTRAGATALTEITAATKPMIIIPKPFMPANHQIHNAKIYRQAQAARLVADNGRLVNRRALLSQLNDLINNPSARFDLSRALAPLVKTDATEQTLAALREILVGSLKATTGSNRQYYYRRRRIIAAASSSLSVKTTSDSPRRAQILAGWRLGLLLLTIMTLIVGLRLAYIGPVSVRPDPNQSTPHLIGADQITEINTFLQETINRRGGLSGWWQRHFRPDLGQINRQIVDRYSYVAKIAGERDWWDSELKIIVRSRAIIGRFQQADRLGVVVDNGLISLGQPGAAVDPRRPLITTEQILAEPLDGRQLLSSEELPFIGLVSDYFVGQERLTRVHQSGRPYELLFRLAGYDFDIVMTTTEDPIKQAIAVDTALEAFNADADLDLPTEYIDVRLINNIGYK